MIEVQLQSRLFVLFFSYINFTAFYNQELTPIVKKMSNEIITGILHKNAKKLIKKN
jgi:hypothetical protein